MTLLHFVHRGRDKARSIGAISEASNVSRRKVERALEDLVQSGIPIVACEDGVYIASTPAEARAYAQSPRGRISAVQARISALERWADAQEAPLSLWDAA